MEATLPAPAERSWNAEGVALRAQERERERLALELHDGVAQTLTSALRYLQTLEAMPPQEMAQRRLTVGRARHLVHQALQELRDVSCSLYPAALSRLGLAAILRQELRRLREETGWQLELLAEEIALPQEHELALYRIIHEAVANARKHSETPRLRVALGRQGAILWVEVRDWGQGFVASTPTGGQGLAIMQRRAELIGARCAIDSRPGKGTVVRVELPLEER